MWDWDAAVFEVCRTPLLLRLPSIPLALPRGHGEENGKCGRQPRGESPPPGRWGREKVQEPPGLPALPKTVLFLPSPGPLRALPRALSLPPPPTRTKAEITLYAVTAALPQKANAGWWGPRGDRCVPGPRESCIFFKLHYVVF